MTREIKFRAWNMRDWQEKNHKMVYWNHFNDIPPFKLDSDYYVMQQTGLKDKNGVEIYEGDVMRRQNGDHDLVLFDKGSFCVRHKNGDIDLIAYHNHFEVIGNIYENPELL